MRSRPISLLRPTSALDHRDHRDHLDPPDLPRPPPTSRDLPRPPPAGDVIESAGLLGRLLAGRSLTGQDVGLVRRTLGDLAKLVPYTIIMVIPMSPPGHVFAFSVLNRVFPGAVPSAFTAQRQDINDIYARIAAEASTQPRHLRLLLRFRRLKSLALTALLYPVKWGRNFRQRVLPKLTRAAAP